MLIEETYKFWDEKIDDISIDLIKCEMKISFSNLSTDLIFKKVKGYMYIFNDLELDTDIEECNTYVELNDFLLYAEEIQIGEQSYSLLDYFSHLK